MILGDYMNQCCAWMYNYWGLHLCDNIIETIKEEVNGAQRGSQDLESMMNITCQEEVVGKEKGDQK